MSSRTTGDDSSAPTPERSPPESVRRLVCCSVSHNTRAETDLCSIGSDDPTALATQITAHDRITEAVVLSTCNRLEVYASAHTPNDRETALQVAEGALSDPDSVATFTGQAAFEHLCRVACGLESKILGEDHVLGQVRSAFEDATDEGLTGGVLTRAADAAIRAGKRSRSETDINEGNLSYGSAACEVIADVAPERLVLVGAGDLAHGVAKVASHRWEDAQIDVVNRSPAPELRDETGGEFWRLSNLATALDGADAVVTATGAPDPVVTQETVTELAPGTPLVDLANPPDVADAIRESDAYPVTDLAAVQDRIEAANAQREGAVPAVEAEIEATVTRFLERERESVAEDTIRALHRQAQSIQQRELDRAKHQLRAGDADPEQVLENFASSLTSSLLDDPTTHLRAAARDDDDAVIDATHRLFDLD